MKKDKVLVLVHGFIKNSKDMRTLKIFFSEHYEKIIAVDLPTTFVNMDTSIKALCEVIKNIPQSKSITFIAHSMGGLITCKAIYELQLKNVDKCVFIASPFAGSKVADFGDRIPFYSRVLKPNKDLKVTDKYLKICNEVASKFPVGLIAGNRNSKFNLLARFCLGKEQDGLVEVDSVFAISSCDRIVLYKNHQEIHHDNETLAYVACFLNIGKFLA
ncbi:alpha/beta hydrolase [Francisella sp. Scap27]|uniref:alpha/beta hydrolase n=1 Tax=Francisella sp. Scap27 TaxID=2589986 RepID=UPI0015BC9792|nr:alpha/beta hydrolase [Francisella sp. Scap27]QLE79903.1 alpha/beta hydrolase [Francisella sp. Scap27]